MTSVGNGTYTLKIIGSRRGVNVYLDGSQGSNQRKKSICAHLLNFILPGVGLLYWGRMGQGAYWVVGSVIYTLILMSFWLIFHVHPYPLGSIAAFTWIFAQGHLIMRVLSSPPAQQPWSRRVTGIFPYFSLALLGLLPIILTLYLGFTRLYAFIRIPNDSMFPQIYQGDLVAVDRRGFSDGLPIDGALVAFECAGVGPVIMRVIISNTAHLTPLKLTRASEQIYIDSRPLFKLPVKVSASLWTQEETRRAQYLRFYEEKIKSSASAYVVAYPRYPDAPQVPSEYTLGKNTLFVLSDHRGADDTWSACEGVVDRVKLIGAPRYIYSHSPSQAPYDDRRGLVIK
jgi:hypothetical protein